jgi:hypothetical protein
MPASPSSGDSSSSTHSRGSALSRASGEIVHEQTVRAPIPMAPATETTVRAPMPTLPQEQTVRAFVPSAVPGGAQALDVEELEELDVEPVTEPSRAPVIDVGALVTELEACARRSDADVPVSRPDQVTAPEAAVKTSELLAAQKPAPRPRVKRRRDEGPALRPEPPAVSGNISVSEPEPGDLFGPAPARRDERARATAPAPAAKPRRDDPPVVSGDIAIDASAAKSPEVPTGNVRVMPMASAAPQSPMSSSGSHPIMLGVGPQGAMTSSGSHPIMTSAAPQSAMAASGSHPIMTAPGPQAMMTSSGSHPIMLGVGSQAARNSSGSHPIMAAPGQPSSMAISGGSPVVPRRASTDSMYVVDGQSRGQSETTGPSPVVRAQRRPREGSRDSLVLWILAGALVVLALGVVMMVISWTQ